MTSLEFQTVLEVLGIPVEIIKKRNIGRNENIYCWRTCWNGFTISFRLGKYYSVVLGAIPMEVANIIYHKYPKNPYKIRVEGGKENWIPIDRGNDSFDTYHIDTKEGLLIFITEMQDYFARKNGQPEIYVKKYSELLEMVSIRLIEQLKPFILIDEWLKNAIKCGDKDLDSYLMYMKTMVHSTETKLDQELRNALNVFDKCVNPFLEENRDINFWKEIISNVSIRGNIFEQFDGMSRKDCMIMTLINKDNFDYVKFIRDPDGFYSILDFGYDLEESFYVIHYVANHYSDPFDNGEILILEHKKFGEDILRVRYNLTLGKIGENYKDMKDITDNQKQLIFHELLLAIAQAEKITMGCIPKENVKIRSKSIVSKNTHECI